MTLAGVRAGRWRCARWHPQDGRFPRQYAVFQQWAEKIQGLPKNRTNEMIRGCEIRSVPDKRPPAGPLHDNQVECRLIVHGF